VIDLGRSCSRHRRVLVDFVDRAEVGPATGAAFAHLEGCPRCTEAVESTVLAITALRRLGNDLAAVEPAPDAWPRLRARITGWRRPVVMSPLAGVAMSVAIVAVVLLPGQLGTGGGLRWNDTPTPTVPSVRRAADHRVEAAYIAFSQRIPADPFTTAASGSLPMNMPEEVLQVRKEVHAAKPSWRSIPPI
jgi:hypothetical protein